MSARERLFVYGTLRPGFAPDAIRSVVATLRPLGAARLRGRLYDLGAYPGLILDPAAEDFVDGEVVECSDAAPPLAWFDTYEGAGFRRERVVAERADGRPVACWVYALSREPVEATRITDGAWRGQGA